MWAKSGVGATVLCGVRIKSVPTRFRSIGGWIGSAKRRILGKPGSPKEAGMSDSQAILSKIAALRQLSAQAAAAPPSRGHAATIDELANKINAGMRQNVLLDGSLRKLADPAQPA